MIREIEGNLLEEDFDIYAHQTNCLGVMGGGLDLQIKKRFPYVFQVYKKLCRLEDENHLLGMCQIVPREEGSDKYVANLFGQNTIGFGRLTGYDALKTALIKLKSFARANNLSVGLSYMLGCGLAGGDWQIVRSIIEDVFKGYEVTLVRLK